MDGSCIRNDWLINEKNLYFSNLITRTLSIILNDYGCWLKVFLVAHLTVKMQTLQLGDIFC